MGSDSYMLNSYVNLKIKLMAQKVNDPVVEAILAQYEKGNEKKSANNASKVFDLKNYFATYLPDGVKEGSKTVRILPGVDGGTPFVPLMVHSKQIKDSNGKTKFEKFICPEEHLGKDCPFCEARKELYASGTDSDKEIAKTLFARKMYVLRVIDRDHEEEGIKFWRIGKDTYDALIGVIKVRGDISNLTTGRDIIIQLKKELKGTKEITSISSIINDDVSETFSTKEAYNSFMEDKRTWSDVYSVKPYGYLEIIVKGGDPVWSKDKECYIDKSEVKAKPQSEYNETIVMGGDVKKQVVKEDVKTPVESTSDESDDDSELPF